MHILHKILVYKEEGFDFLVSEKERISEARSIATSETEDYYGSVYDWRETDTAGRWTEEYPKQAYFAKDDIDWFVKEINEAIASQKCELNSYLTELKEKVGTDIEKMVSVFMGDTQLCEVANVNYSFLPFALWKIARITYGEYNCDSYIFNTNGHTARIYPEDIEQIKQEPEKWALVMFDYHY